jgi:hypothetical protein
MPESQFKPHPGVRTTLPEKEGDKGYTVTKYSEKRVVLLAVNF